MKLTIRYDDGREVVEHALGWGHATKIARERFRPSDGNGGRGRNDAGDPVALIEFASPLLKPAACRPVECATRLRWADDHAKRGREWMALFDERGGAQ